MGGCGWVCVWGGGGAQRNLLKSVPKLRTEPTCARERKNAGLRYLSKKVVIESSYLKKR